MSDEGKLLAEFSADRSEQAFAAIVKLHVRLVFATAYRQVGDRALAEEVTQNVFMALAEKAGSLKGNRTLAGWLYQTTLNQSRQMVRSELRRQRREELAAACAEASREGSSTWAGLIPLLDEAVMSLSEPERFAVILHFMEGRPFREVGLQLGVGEDAARKRVNRALTWLTDWFGKRGFPVTTGTLAAGLSLEGIPAASAGLAGSIGAVCAGAPAVPVASGGTGAMISTLGIIMASTKTKVAVATVMIGLIATAPMMLRDRSGGDASRGAESERDTGAGGRETLELPPKGRVQNSIRPLPEANAPAVAARQKSLLERVNEGDESLSLLPREKAEAFVAQNRTNAESLLAAYRVTRDAEYLRAAASRFTNDPAVMFRVAAHNAFPEEKRAWLDHYKEVDANNSLPYYLSAADHMKAGELAAAFQDLGAAAGRSAFQDHVTENILTLEDIYLAAGHSAADAKGLAACAVELPHLSQINELSRNMVELVKQYQQAGDTTSAQNLVGLGLKLSGHIANIQEGGNLLGQIVAVRTERAFLDQLNPNQSYPFVNGSVADRIDAGRAREQRIREDSQFVNQWIPEATEADIVNYFDRLKLQGESAAIDWLRNRREGL